MNQSVEARPTLYERSINFSAEQLEHAARQIIQSAKDRPEESAKAVDVARRVGEQLVKELKDG